MSRRSSGTPDDPVALRSRRLVRVFDRIMTRQMQGTFRAVRVARPGVPDLPPGRPVVVFTNHPSWWDPAFFMVLAARLFPRHEAYGPMDDAMLQRYGFARRLGVFGVRPGGRSGAAAFLRAADRIMDAPQRMLWITAQGEFHDPRDRPVALRPGAAHLMARRDDAVAVPLALEYPFWTEKRPEALALFGAPLDVRDGGSAAEWNARLAAALEQAMDALARLAAARDAQAFTRLVGGRSGVGGVWGAWSRARAALRGDRYVADHMEEG